MNLPDLGAMYRDAGRGLAGTLTCSVCHRVQSCTAEDAAAYLARGWPKCCGYTMTLETFARAPASKEDAE